MASTYVNDLRLNELATGDASGSWGTITNTNLELIAEAFSFGTEAIPTNVTDSTHTTTIADGATDPGRSMFLTYTGSQNANVTVTLAPNTVSKMWFIENATTGSSVNLIIKQGSGATVTIPHGQTKAIYSDGAGSGAKIVDAFASLSVVDLKVQDDLTVTDDVAIGGLATVGGTLAVTGVLTTTAATVFNGGFASNAASTITSTTNGTLLTLQSSEAGASSGPDIVLLRNSTSPADDDALSTIFFQGKNSAGATKDYMKVRSFILDVTDGTEDFGMDFQLMTAGNTVNALDILPTEIIINNAGVDRDFRVESNNNANMLFVDGGEDAVGIGTVPPAWRAGYGDVGFNVGVSAALYDQTGGGVFLVNNWYRADDNTLTYRNTNEAQYMVMDGGITSFANAASGSAGSAITFTETLKIAADGSLSTPSLGTSNFKAGVNAGNSILSGGNENVFIGDEAGTAITISDANVAVGFAALKTEDEHGFNTAIGYESLKVLNAGTDGHNTAVGFRSGLAMNTGTRNTVLGSSAGIAITEGNQNTVVGESAGLALAHADYNTVLGRAALPADTTGGGATAVGYNTLAAQNFTDATANYNVAVGYEAGASISTGIYNVHIGGLAGRYSTTTNSSVFIGFQAGLGISGTKLTGNDNIAIGRNAGALLQGAATLNTFVGTFSGDAVTTGTENTFVGNKAGSVCTDSELNTAVGTLALGNGDAGNLNVAIGRLSLYACTGSNNTACGGNAGNGLTSGSNSSIFGFDAGRSGSPGGDPGSTSNSVYIGDENVAECHIQTDWTVASDQRDKTDFTALDLGLDFVKALAPVTYKWDKRSKYGDKYADDYDLLDQTPDGTHKEDWLDIGFKAQEVQALEEAAGYTATAKKNLTVSTSGDGKQMGIQYSKFIPILVKAIQEQNALIEALTARVATLEG